MKGTSAFILFVVVFFATTLPSRGQEVSDFDEIVDFSITLKDLHTLAAETSSNSQTRSNVNVDEFPLLLIDGYIASTVVHQDTEEAFSATIELIDGEWQELDQVNAYRARLVAEGEAFRERIPSRPPSSPRNDEILAGRRGIALVRLQSFQTDTVSGNPIAVLEILRFRVTR